MGESLDLTVLPEEEAFSNLDGWETVVCEFEPPWWKCLCQRTSS